MGCLGVGGGVGDWVGVSDGGEGNYEKSQKKVPKTPPSPAKTEVLHEKKCIFLLKKTTQPRKKLKFCMKN